MPEKKKKSVSVTLSRRAYKKTSLENQDLKPVLKKSRRNSKDKKERKGEIVTVSKKLPSPLSPAAKVQVSSPFPSSGSSVYKNYIHFISRFPLLSREEEYKLAVEYYEKKNPKAAEKLVQSNLRFVIKVAGEYSKFSSKIMDLIQEGNLGLIKAVREFNPYKGVRLITYAVWWIKGYIQEYLIRQHSLVRIGTNKKEKALYYLLQREKDTLDQLTHTKLLPEMSRHAKASVEELETMKRRVFFKDISLDQPIKADGSASLLDFQEDPSQNNLEERISDSQQVALLRKFLKKIEPQLNKQEKAILHNRLLKSKPDTLQQIADTFGITREAVRQTEQRLLLKLKKKLVPLLKKPH